MIPRKMDDAEIIFEAVRGALQPFHVHHINLQVIDNLSEPRYFYVTVDALPRYKYRKTVDEDFYTGSPEEILQRIANQVADFYRSIRLPVDDHIHLGEE